MPSIFEFIANNLWSSAPLILVAIFAVGIIVERLRALYMVYPLRNEMGFYEKIRDLIMEGKTAEGVALCERYSAKPVAQIVKKALLRAHQPESLIANGIELAVEEEIDRVQRRTQFLAMIANVATLLGLLGTIGGLISAFQGIGSFDAAQRTTLLAQGISEAMNHTMMGLGVAIPAMVMFSFLMNRTNRITSGVETAAVRVLDYLKQRYFQHEKDGRGAA